VIFRAPFLSILIILDAIGIYRKTGPTKSTVLGPRPPPWDFHKIYRFLSIFTEFGVFNRAGKTVSKIGIYALPPPKCEFYSVFIEIYHYSWLRQFIATHYSIVCYLFWSWYCLLLFPFLVLSRIGYSEFFWCFVKAFMCWGLLFLVHMNSYTKQTPAAP
jgi:hypothetical protein